MLAMQHLEAVGCKVSYLHCLSHSAKERRGARVGALRARETHSRKGPRDGADREKEYVQGGGRCELP